MAGLSLYIRTMMVLLGCTTVWSQCHIEKYNPQEQCSFEVDCMQTIHIKLPPECQSSSNNPVVDLRLNDARNDVNNITDNSALGTITTLRVSGNLETFHLSFLDFMPRLKHLYMIDGHFTELTPKKPFYHLNRLETLDISHNSLKNITNLFQFDNYENMLKRIFLTNNHIHEIKKDTFQELGDLFELDLSHNKIREIAPGTFSQLYNLHILRINNNYIVSFNGVLNDLKNLKELYVENNELNEIDVDSELMKLNQHLQILNVSGNKIATLTPTVFWRHWLHFDGKSTCVINLSNNVISSIPNAVTPWVTDRFIRHLGIKYIADVVTSVDLSKNKINNIEYNAFQAIEKLQSLDVSSNKIVSFKVNPDHLKDVKHLNISKNVLETLFSETFSKMTQLENLDVSHNKISHISEDTFKNNINLKYINFTYNIIKEVHYLQMAFQSGDGELNFSNNEIQLLIFGRELKLARLLLQHNKITNMIYVNLHQFSDLKHLQISNNQITELNETSVRLPQSLIYLDLSHNEITIISPSTFANLNRLITLRLSHNKITTLDFGIFLGLSSLKNLDLSNNEMITFSSKVFTELRMLRYLWLKHNQLVSFDDSVWISHDYELLVYIDGNNLTCEWLSRALRNYYKGYSKMRLTSQIKRTDGNSVDGIPCESTKSQRLQECSESGTVLADERLLMINKQILQAIKDQTNFIKIAISLINTPK